jgi:hypothetical protein
MLHSVSNVLKGSALAALIGIGLASAGTTPAAADTLKTRCYGGQCYRLQCNDFGYDCVRVAYLGNVGFLRHRDRYVCDADGDECHWVRARVYDEDMDEDFED